jgi:Asp-tRNA(Asn)/Glu-tRNA(Gln) amidotransferase A subunit family amidase
VKEAWKLGLVDAARAIAERNLTSERLTRSCLLRIAELEETIGAWAWLDTERAIDIAREADTKRSVLALHGVPIGVKDMMPVAGLPCEFGSPLYANYVPESSAEIVKSIEAAGAFVLGKTVTAEFAFLSPGKTRNPWNTEHTPGGSSSGSAAAVALGFVPAALGTQTNGSTIRPAAFCGIVGFKPSFDLISLAGAQPFSPTLDQAGIFTRSVHDAEFMTTALAEVEIDEALATMPPRLAAIRSPVWHLAGRDMQNRFAEDIGMLRGAGAEVLETEFGEIFAGAHSCLRTIMLYEGAVTFRILREQHRDGLSQTLNRALAEGEATSEEEYRAALAQRRSLQDSLDELLQSFDAIVTPSATGEAPRGLSATGDPAFCTIWTLCGVPAITIPTGLGGNGLPLGLQIVGRYRHDSTSLQVAEWCARQLPFRGLITVNGEQ